jgi:hypothetical protein
MLAVATAGVAVLLVGCGGSGATGSRLAVEMSDAALPGVTAVNVTVDRVEAHVNEAWIPVAVPQATYNLLEYQTNAALLGSAAVPPGDYTQMRVFVTDATVTDADGDHEVIIPSNVQTGVKLNVNYSVEPGKLTTVLLDFNVCKSLIKQGNGQYRLKPVIPAVVKVMSGTVTGVVTLDGNPVEGASIAAVYTAGTEYALDTEVNNALTDANGEFKVWALMPGTYRIDVTWTDTNTTTDYAGSAADKVVTADVNTDAGTITLAAL